jgi:hypothetical protein
MSNTKTHGHDQQRESLPKKEFKTLGEQFNELRVKDLTTYTMEKHSTSYPDAKADVSVFDETGALVINGREFGNHIFYWKATAAV